MYTIIASFKRSVILLHTHYGYIYIYGAFSFAPLADSLAPLCTPFHLLGTLQLWQESSTSSRVACKLTLFAPPFTQLSHPFQLPRTPTAQRLTTTTLGLFRSCYAEQSWPTRMLTLLLSLVVSTVEAGGALGVTGVQLVLLFPRCSGKLRNPLNFTLLNSCSTCLPYAI